ncbi:hypothetical protein Tco_0811627 [Tanacetum coccineum]
MAINHHRKLIQEQDSNQNATCSDCGPTCRIARQCFSFHKLLPHHGTSPPLLTNHPVINSISVIKFKKDDSLIEGTDCSVCLSEFQDDETLRMSFGFYLDDPSFSRGIGSNRHNPIENFDEGGGLDGNGIGGPDSENCEDIEDSKTEYESVIAGRRSFSMDSVAVSEIINGEIEFFCDS